VKPTFSNFSGVVWTGPLRYVQKVHELRRRDVRGTGWLTSIPHVPCKRETSDEGQLQDLNNPTQGTVCLPGPGPWPGCSKPD